MPHSVWYCIPNSHDRISGVYLNRHKKYLPNFKIYIIYAYVKEA